MIEYKQGDLLSVTEGVIIHGCNAQGVMGAGVALAVKNKYPRAYDAYKKFEEKYGALWLGSISLAHVNKELSVANVITQHRYGKDPSIKYVSYGAIHLGFDKLNEYYSLDRTFHFPKIGAGLGNGDWNIIASLIELACPDRKLICWEL